MVSLATAKQHLGVEGTDQDDDITRLISSVTAYLSSIDVTVDPEPGPVGEAILIMLQQLYMRRSVANFGLRQEEIPGVRTVTYFDPKLLDDSNSQLVGLLVAPYRKISL